MAYMKNIISTLKPKIIKDPWNDDDRHETRSDFQLFKNWLAKSAYMIISVWVILSVIVWIIENYKSDHQIRLEFLNNNCYLVDVGYEIFYDGKSTYKCLNGKEYRKRLLMRIGKRLLFYDTC